MLTGDAHVSIDGIKFQLDMSVDKPYHYRVQKMLAENSAIEGIPGKNSLKNDVLWWGFTDWSGGEGHAVYYDEYPTVYYISGALNPRNRGYITGRPNRVRTTVTVTDEEDRPFAAVGGQFAFVLGSKEGFYTKNATTFTALSTTVMGTVGGGMFDAANFRVTALTGDVDGIYFSMYHSGSSGSRGLRKVTSSSASGIIAGASVQDVATGKAPYAGLCVLNGKLYAWTGRKLFELDIEESYPLASDKVRVVYNTGVEPPNANVFSATWWADCIATESSVIFFFSNNAQSKVYEYKKDSGRNVAVGRQFWTAPYGFTIKSAIYQNGKVFFFGHWSGDENVDGWGSAYCVAMDSRAEIFLGHFRSESNENLQMQECANSYGKQILVAGANTGRIFVYDGEFNSISMLDDLQRTSGSDPDSLSFTDNDERVGCMLTYGQYRFAVLYDPGGSGTTYQIVTYDTDHLDDRETGMNTTNYTGLDPSVTSPLHDFDFPMELKNLFGITCTFRPLISGQHIKVEYNVDDAGWVTIDTLDFGETGASLGRKFFQVSTPSSNVNFYEMQYRVTLTGDTGVVSPVLKAVYVGARIPRKINTWELYIRVKDEESGTRITTGRQKGGRIRDRLRDIVDNEDVVTLIDGFRYGPVSTTPSSTHSVTIREIDDAIAEPGEGTMRVVLEEIPV